MQTAQVGFRAFMLVDSTQRAIDNTYLSQIEGSRYRRAATTGLPTPQHSMCVHHVTCALCIMQGGAITTGAH